MASPAGQVAILTDSAIEIWDPDNEEFVRRLDLPANCFVFSGLGLAFHGTADDGTVAASCNDSSLVAWDLTSPGPDPAWTLPKSAVEMEQLTLLSPDGSQIVDKDGPSMRSVDVESGAVLGRSSELDWDQMVSFAFSPDGSVVAVVSWSGDIDLLRSDDLGLIRRLRSSTGTVGDPGFPDG